jgi:phosphatidylglycerophosphatase A
VKSAANLSATLLATFFGFGYFPWGPGTLASLAAVAIAAALHVWLHLDRLGLLCLTVILLAPAIWSATRTARLLRLEDPSSVVIDEVLGQWVTLLGAAVLNWKSLAAGLVLFRLFDIWKPSPVRNFEKLPEGLGIVADDLAAGLYGALILYVGGVFRLY